MLAHAASLRERPKYGLGGHGVVRVGEFASTISVMRSMQHKDARMCTEADSRSLQTCMFIQVASGFFTTFSDYMRTIFIEDVGIADIKNIMRVQELCMNARDITATLPLGDAGVQRLLDVNRELIAIMAHTKRSRMVAEMASIALLRTQPDSDHKRVALGLPALIAVCRRTEILDVIGVDMRAAVSALTAAIISKSDTWSLIGFKDSSVVSTLRKMSKCPGASETLCVHMALWVVCLRQENVRPAQRLQPVELNLMLPFAVPEYAFDKHTAAGRNAGHGYVQFYKEGIRCDPAKRLWARQEDTLLEECLRLRLDYELKHGPGSSKGRMVVRKLTPNVPAKKRKDPPAMQPRTARHKVLVHYFVDHVLKGPYKSRNDPRVLAQFAAVDFISQVDRARGVPCTVLAAPEVVERPEGTFLRWPNIGRHVAVPRTEVIENRVMSKTAIIPRGTVVDRLSDLKAPSAEQRARALNHFYSRALARVGDTNVCNILVDREGQVFGIDLEETRGEFKQTDDLLALLCPKLPAGADAYRAELHRVRRLSRADAERLLDVDQLILWERIETLTAAVPAAP